MLLRSRSLPWFPHADDAGPAQPAVKAIPPGASATAAGPVQPPCAESAHKASIPPRGDGATPFSGDDGMALLSALAG